MKQWWLPLLLFLTACSAPFLAPEELVALKRDCTFWTWERGEKSYQIHYLERGQGPHHLLFVHGYGGYSYSWRHQIDFFAARGYHVWAIDLLGFGWSDKPIDEEYSLPLYREQVTSFIEEMGLGKVHLVGHSMGGAIALAVGLEEGDRLLSLTLLAPVAYPMDLPLLFAVGKHFKEVATPLFTRKLLERGLHQIFFDRRLVTEELIEKYWLPYRVEGGREAAIGVLQGFDRERLEAQAPRYPTLSLPLLLVWGAQDRSVPPSHLERFQGEVPHAEQALFEACGHAPHEESPERFNRLLFTFLQKG